jgi:hypothetical protein
MNRTSLVSPIRMGWTVATILFGVIALNSPAVNANFDGKQQFLLAQQDRFRFDRQYSVYYSNRRDFQWTLEGIHFNLYDAEWAARRLQRRGYKTDIRANEESNSGGGRKRELYKSFTNF